MNWENFRRDSDEREEIIDALAGIAGVATLFAGLVLLMVLA